MNDESAKSTFLRLPRKWEIFLGNDVYDARIDLEKRDVSSRILPVTKPLELLPRGDLVPRSPSPLSIRLLSPTFSLRNQVEKFPPSWGDVGRDRNWEESRAVLEIGLDSAPLNSSPSASLRLADGDKWIFGKNGWKTGSVGLREGWRMVLRVAAF